VEIGHILYDSHIYEICLRIPGVVAVHSLRFGTWTQEVRAVGPSPNPGTPPEESDLADEAAAVRISLEAVALFDPYGHGLGSDWRPEERVDPGDVAVEFIREDVVHVETGVRHSPGEGRFYLLAGDRLHITAEVARHGE
jgi:hypothetical protein